MRLIEEQMCNAVINKNDWRKDNTEVLYSPSRDVCCVYLHKNLIATIDNNSVEIYDGGWQSNTTKSRLNALINGLCNGYRQGIFQKNYEWFITDNNETVEFAHGYTFSRVNWRFVYTQLMSKVKLKDVTFTRGSKPIKTLLWCDQQKRAKRNKPAKLNGIVVTNSIEVFHEL